MIDEMDDSDRRVIEMLHLALQGETVFLEKLEADLKRLGVSDNYRKNYFMPLVRMIRCYGQLDGVVAMQETVGDIAKIAGDVCAEISSITAHIQRV